MKGKALEELHIYIDQEGGTFDPAISGCAIKRGPEIAVPGPDVGLRFYQSSNNLQICGRGGQEGRVDTLMWPWMQARCRAV